jgi:glutamate racemase
MLERRFDVPIFGVIVSGRAGARSKKRATNASASSATSTTIRTPGLQQSHSRALRSRRKSSRAPVRCSFRSSRKRGRTTKSPTTVLREYLAPLLRQRIDTLVLGCTHYPLLKPAIRKVVGDGIALIDSAESCAALPQGKVDRAEAHQREPPSRGDDPAVCDG